VPRRPRLSNGGIAYHVLNRRVGRLELFEKPADYSSAVVEFVVAFTGGWGTIGLCESMANGTTEKLA